MTIPSVAQAHTNVTATNEVLPAINYAELFGNLKETFSSDAAGCSEPEGSKGFFRLTIAGYCSNINRERSHW